jgi:hypothetical protein
MLIPTCLLWAWLLWQSGNPIVLALPGGIILVGLFASHAWSLRNRTARMEAALRALNVGCGFVLMLVMQKLLLLLFTCIGVTTSLLQWLNWLMAISVFLVSLVAALVWRL